MDYRSALTGDSSDNNASSDANQASDSVNSSEAPDVPETSEIVQKNESENPTLNSTPSSESAPTDSKDSQQWNSVGKKKNSGRGNSRGKGSSSRGRGGASRGRGGASRGRGGAPRGRGGRGGEKKVNRTQEYWDAFNKATDIFFKECLFTRDEVETADANVMYLKGYRGFKKYIDLKSTSDDIINVEGSEETFLRSKLVESKSFINRLKDHYEGITSSMYVKCYYHERQKSIIISLVPVSSY